MILFVNAKWVRGKNSPYLDVPLLPTVTFHGQHGLFLWDYKSQITRTGVTVYNRWVGDEEWV